MNIPLFFEAKNAADFYTHSLAIQSVPHNLDFRLKCFARMMWGGMIVAMSCLFFLQRGFVFAAVFSSAISLVFWGIQRNNRKPQAARLLQQLNRVADFAALDESSATWHSTDGSRDEYQWAHFVACLITPHSVLLLHEDRVVVSLLPFPADPQLAADMLKLLREKIPNQIAPRTP